jgi:hypothetical protein
MVPAGPGQRPRGAPAREGVGQGGRVPTRQLVAVAGARLDQAGRGPDAEHPAAAPGAGEGSRGSRPDSRRTMLHRCPPASCATYAARSSSRVHGCGEVVNAVSSTIALRSPRGSTCAKAASPRAGTRKSMSMTTSGSMTGSSRTTSQPAKASEAVGVEGGRSSPRESNTQSARTGPEVVSTTAPPGTWRTPRTSACSRRPPHRASAESTATARSTPCTTQYSWCCRASVVTCSPTATRSVRKQRAASGSRSSRSDQDPQRRPVSGRSC